MRPLRRLPLLALWLAVPRPPPPASATANVFLDSDEVRKILGLNKSSIFYLQEGVVNEYALSFVMPIPATVTALRFSWQSKSRRKTPYRLGLKFGSADALASPEVDVPREGLVPSRLESFTVLLPCNGLLSAEVDVLIELNITLPAPLSDSVNLNIRRKKICMKGCAYEKERKAVVCSEPSPPPPERKASVLQDLTGRLDQRTVYVIAGCFCGLLLTIVAVAIVLCVRKEKSRRKRRRRSSELSDDASYGNYQMLFSLTSSRHFDACRGLERKSDYTTLASFQNLPVKRPFEDSKIGEPEVASVSPAAGLQAPGLLRPFAATRTQHSQTSLSSGGTHSTYKSVFESAEECAEEKRGSSLTALIRSLSELVFGQTVMEGTLGRITHGIYLGDSLLPRQEVMIKSLADSASPSQKTAFLSQALMTYGLCHGNVLSVIGLCVPSLKSLCVFYPHTERGNLKRFLISERGGRSSLTCQDVLDMAMQITAAVNYLHANHIVHRDLATRNCYVGSGFNLKVADGALSGDLFPDDYSCLYDSEKRPIKWMAPESLMDHNYSSSSDVWSLGIVLWELLTLARQPYSDVEPLDMCNWLKEGYRLMQPSNCPDEVFAVMLACWEENPKDRLGVQHIEELLGEVSSLLGSHA